MNIWNYSKAKAEWQKEQKRLRQMRSSGGYWCSQPPKPLSEARITIDWICKGASSWGRQVFKHLLCQITVQ